MYARMLGLALAAALAAAPGAQAASPCAPAGSRALAGNERVRVFELPARSYATRVFACWRRTRRVTQLDVTERPRTSLHARQTVTAIRVAGDFVAYDLLRRCSERVCAGSVRIVNVRTGARMSSRGTPGDGQRVTALVLNSRGSAAWIRYGNGTRELHKLDSDGVDLIERADDIAPRELRLRASMLSWHRGGLVHDRRLDAGLPCGVPRSSTVIGTSDARLFQVRGSFYGCLLSRDVPVRLGSGARCFPDSCGVRLLRLATPFVAVDSGFAGRGGASADLDLVDLRDGRRAHVWRPERGRTLTVDAELLPSGSVAWTAFIDSPDRYFVFKSEAGGEPVLLDRGPEIDPDSLELNDGALTWRKGAERRTATLR